MGFWDFSDAILTDFCLGGQVNFDKETGCVGGDEDVAVGGLGEMDTDLN